MFRKPIVNFLIVAVLVFSSVASFAQNVALSNNIDKSRLNSGIIGVDYSFRKDTKMKVMISKGNSQYTYDLKSNNTYPLQFGNGKYIISILENVEGNKYRLLGEEEIDLKLKDKNQVFLQSIQLINWNEDMETIKKAREITKDAKNGEEKVKAIYNYIINNISYDNKKAKSVQAGYIPSIDETINSGKAICYDYAALFAGMLRSVDIPTKLIMGYKNDIEEYHAWNEVYLNDKWITIDTTYDSAYAQNKLSISMIKDPKEYSIEKQY